jgi:hypothetical protein
MGIKDKQQETLSPMRKEEIPLNDGRINTSLPRRSIEFYLLEEKGMPGN